MRPHYVLGYAALAAAVIHLFGVMGNMSGANSTGIWFATAAFAGLAVQTFVGMNLQSPGAYRRPLRRWHTMLFWSIALAAGVHVLLN